MESVVFFFIYYIHLTLVEVACFNKKLLKIYHVSQRKINIIIQCEKYHYLSKIIWIFILIFNFFSKMPLFKTFFCWLGTKGNICSETSVLFYVWMNGLFLENWGVSAKLKREIGCICRCMNNAKHHPKAYVMWLFISFCAW